MKNSNCSLNKLHNNKGITLIELLLYVTLASAVLTSISIFLNISLVSKAKSQTIIEVDQQGNFAMRKILKTIRQASAVNTPRPSDDTPWSQDIFDGSTDGTYTNTTAANSNSDVSLLGQTVTLSNQNSGNWTRGKPLTITNFQSNFQTKIVVAYDTDMQNDFDDIRFYDGTNELPYWIESKTDGSTATIWFKTHATTSTSSNIDIYYGNSLATTSSNGSTLFSYFDDFEGYSNAQSLVGINNWSVTQGTMTASTSYAAAGTKAGKWLRNSGSTIQVGAFWDFGLRSSDFILEYNYRYIQRGGVFGTGTDTSPNWGSSAQYAYPTNVLALISGTNISNSFVSTNWYKFKEVHHPTTKNYDLTISNGLDYTSSAVAYHQLENPRYFMMVTDSSSALIHEVYVDNIFIRSYAASEPSVSLGTEARLGYAASGTFTSNAITLSETLSWNAISFTSDYSGAGTTIKIQALDSDNQLIPDSALTGNSDGFTASPINISTLSTITYPTIKLLANLTTSNIVNTPLLNDWTVSFAASNVAEAISLDTTSGSTTINLADGILKLTNGTSPALNLTTDKVTISNLTFSNVSKSSTRDNIKVSFTASYNSSSNRNEFKYTQTFNGTANVR